eukprot:scaffold213858_cov15-Tisochrysis_lutea.AAC.1
MSSQPVLFAWLCKQCSTDVMEPTSCTFGTHTGTLVTCIIRVSLKKQTLLLGQRSLDAGAWMPGAGST